jgi:hypothetical protein
VQLPGVQTSARPALQLAHSAMVRQMRRLTAFCAQLSILGPAALLGAAHADPGDGGENGAAPHWSTFVTPRVEETEYTPHLDSSGFGEMTVGGLSITEQTPDQRFTFNAIAYYGAGSLDYQNHQVVPAFPEVTYTTMNYHAERTDVALNVGYTPHGSNVTLIGGVRYGELQVRESSTVAPFTSNYTDRLPLLEIGARIAGKLTPDSRHEMYAQVTGGLGPCSYTERTTSLTPISSNQLGGEYEGAIGYSYILSNHIQLGARAHVLFFTTELSGPQSRPANQFGERAGVTGGPELNLTYKF